MRLGVKTEFILRATIAKHALFFLGTSMGRVFTAARPNEFAAAQAGFSVAVRQHFSRIDTLHIRDMRMLSFSFT
jgi:hypothetical protein